MTANLSDHRLVCFVCCIDCIFHHAWRQRHKRKIYQRYGDSLGMTNSCLAMRLNMHKGLSLLCTHEVHLAMTKSSLTMRLPSPMYFCTSSLPETLMKVQSVWWATARASRVLPVPGGPYSSTPWSNTYTQTWHSRIHPFTHFVTYLCRHVSFHGALPGPGAIQQQIC